MLEVKDLAVTYGRHRALDGVGLKVAKGEICVILGANGAGKSTLLKAIAGMVKADAGDVVMNCRPIAGMKPHRIVEEGIALVPEGRGIFGDLTVAENLQLGAFAKRARSSEEATLRQIYSLFPRLSERKAQIARTMSGGEQQMVAIGRALMSRPDVLMLDEPSLGLSPLLTQELFRSLAAVASSGVGVLLVEQNARQSLKVASRGYLIENGHVTGENTAEALRRDPAVIAAYLGGAGRGAGAKPSIHLPPAMHLPAAVASIGRLVGDLAARAGRIQQAFVRSSRRDEVLPSAFVGRYDPQAGGDPWATVASASERPDVPKKAADDARQIAFSSANLARRATERLAEHVATARRSTSVPSAFQSREPIVFRPNVDVGDMPYYEPRRLNGSHSLIGHNSGPMNVDDDQPKAAEPAAPPTSPASMSISELVARAAAISASHIASGRKTLTAFTIPVKPQVAPVAADDDDWIEKSGTVEDEDHAVGRRPKHDKLKKKHRKHQETR